MDSYGVSAAQLGRMDDALDESLISRWLAGLT